MTTKRFHLIRLVAFALAALTITTTLNLLVDVGAHLHDAFCANHGWVNSGHQRA